jgi:hypothetical protein
MSYMTDIQSDLGESATLSVVTKTVNKWGDAAESTASKTVTGVFQIMAAADDEVQEGILETGDLTIFFDSSATNLSYVVPQNRISYKSQDYEIVEVVKESTLDSQSHYEVHCKRI